MFRQLIVFCFFSIAFCAKSNWDGRIVGGKDADIEDFPYQVSLRFLDDHFCGASILSEKYVLTAAHCTIDNLARFLSVHAGTTDKNSGEGQTVKVAKYINHPKFVRSTMDYDVSILELAEPLKFTTNVQKIRLPSEGEELKAGTTATISGWGKLAEGGSSSETLKQVDVHVISEDDCQMIYGNIVSDRMICTAEPEGGKDSCQGDSGGPLVVDGKQFGIVSWGIGCARPDKAGVYTKVSKVRDFIKEHAGI